MNKNYKDFQKWKLDVLIDTWWNVNINFSGKMAQMTSVLIDTWWNVNTEKKLSSLETIEF